MDHEKVGNLLGEVTGILEGLRSTKGEAFVAMVETIKVLESMTSMTFNAIDALMDSEPDEQSKASADLLKMGYGMMVQQVLQLFNSHLKLTGDQVKEALQMAKVVDRYMAGVAREVHGSAPPAPGGADGTGGRG